MSKDLKLPGLEAGATSRALAMRKTGGGSMQKIYADKIQLFNADDEDSVLKSLQFMAPGGR
jgi:hypothetical protein